MKNNQKAIIDACSWVVTMEDGTITDIKGIDIFHFIDGKLALKDAYRKTKM